MRIGPLVPLVASLALAGCSLERTVTVDSTPSDATVEATWRLDPVHFPADGIDRFDALSVIDPGRIMLGTVPTFDATGVGSTDGWAFTTADGLEWTRTTVPLRDGTEVVAPFSFMATVRVDHTLYTVTMGNRLVDPGNPDGSGVHAEPSEAVGMVFWTSDDGATWEHAAALVPSRFDAIGVVGDAIWIGGATGDFPRMQGHVWRLDGEAIVDEGDVGEPGSFRVVGAIDDVDGAPVPQLVGDDYARTPYQRSADRWKASGPAQPVTGDGTVDTGPNGVISARSPEPEHDGTTFAMGYTDDRQDLGFCFQDAPTCRQTSLAIAFRVAGGAWQRMAIPDGFATAGTLPLVVMGDELWLYRTDARGVPVERAALDLRFAPPAFIGEHVPELPAPAFDGTLEPGVPEAVEVMYGCGAEVIEVNGQELQPVSFPAAFPADVPQRRIEVSDGPNVAVYGLLVLDDAGVVHFRSVNGDDLFTYEAAQPPQYVCG